MSMPIVLEYDTKPADLMRELKEVQGLLQACDQAPPWTRRGATRSSAASWAGAP